LLEGKISEIISETDAGNGGDSQSPPFKPLIYDVFSVTHMQSSQHGSFCFSTRKFKNTVKELSNFLILSLA